MRDLIGLSLLVKSHRFGKIRCVQGFKMGSCGDPVFGVQSMFYSSKIKLHPNFSFQIKRSRGEIRTYLVLLWWWERVIQYQRSSPSSPGEREHKHDYHGDQTCLDWWLAALRYVCDMIRYNMDISLMMQYLRYFWWYCMPLRDLILLNLALSA